MVYSDMMFRFFCGLVGENSDFLIGVWPKNCYKRVVTFCDGTGSRNFQQMLFQKIWRSFCLSFSCVHFLLVRLQGQFMSCLIQSYLIGVTLLTGD